MALACPWLSGKCRRKFSEKNNPTIRRIPSKILSMSADASVTEVGISLQRASRKQRISSPARNGSTSLANRPT